MHRVIRFARRCVARADPVARADALDVVATSDRVDAVSALDVSATSVAVEQEQVATVDAMAGTRQASSGSRRCTREAAACRHPRIRRASSS